MKILFLEYCFRKIIYCVNAKDELESFCLEVEWNNIQNIGRYFFNSWSVLSNRSVWCACVNSRVQHENWMTRADIHDAHVQSFQMCCYSNQIFPSFWITRA